MQSIGDLTPPAQRRRIEWGQNLAQLMQTHSKTGMTHKELVHRLEQEGVSVSRQAVSLWLRGVNAPRPDVQVAIGRIFRRPVHLIFSVKDVA